MIKVLLLSSSTFKREQVRVRSGFFSKRPLTLVLSHSGERRQEAGRD
jgi:hypothetical protein